ncbi:AAA family ATPase [Anaeromicropila populeti]|uniref:MinD-like ATPase involved in chromosome partitioning or flagellar assembly n=1 Tax=Anaeromicropila populeti TaxID=37658 RepID=A0A1I6JFC4_9FIRM|nr:AAA family ATPase [Anaeromicropila populeti]SFR77677.1 MinD-like ATPase involved in chromosome partitioning or flagellar assembly [Anaeromicropila populeti]
MNKSGKMVAIWGSGNVGKTTTSIKLALALAKKQKESIILLTDINAPDLKCILPGSKELKSMGEIWNMPNLDETALYEKCVVTPSESICMMGYAPGENAFSYSDSTKENVFRVYEEMRTIVDYVIIDCVSNLAYNMPTAVALEIADYVVRIGEATTKSFSFFDSNLPLLVDSRYGKENHIRVLSKVTSEQPVEVAVNYLGCDLKLPDVKEIKKQGMEGTLFDKLSGKDGTAYDAGIQKIASLVCQEV